MAKYAKGIVALVGAVVAIASVRYGAESWFQYVVSLATALGVYAVPNSGSTEIVKY